MIDHFPGFVRDLPALDLPIPNTSGWLIQGEKTQVVFIEFTEATDVPEHSHREQWEFVLSGSVLVSSEGEDTEYQSGDNFFVPARVLHSARVQAGYRAMVIFNERDRY